MPFKNSEDNIEYHKQYYQNHREHYSDWSQKYYSENREEKKEYSRRYSKRNKEARKTKDRKIRLDAFRKIAEFHNSPIQCHRCGESRIWLLTIAHLNNDGCEDRKKISTSIVVFCRAILTNERELDDLDIECYNCNISLYMNGLYPDEMTEEIWLRGKLKISNEEDDNE